MRQEPLRVLVVDDHSVVRRGTRRILEEAGIEVTGEAATAEQALEIIEHAASDVVLADVRLPGMSGIELITELRRRHPGTRVLVLSSYGDPGYVRAALEAGAAGYMLKTASDEELISAVRSGPWGPRSSTRPSPRSCSPRAHARPRRSPTASARSSGSSPGACRTRRSPMRSPSASAPSTRTWPTCSPSSACRRALSSWPGRPGTE